MIIKKQLTSHLTKADIVLIDYKNLSTQNQSIINSWIEQLDATQKSKILIMHISEKKFTAFRSKSFYLDGNEICSCLVLFFKLSDSLWYSLSIGEGVSSIKCEQSEPNLINLIEIDNRFAYPVDETTFLNKYINKKIIGIFEYRLKSVAHENSVGVYFECDECGFSVLENNDCLSFFDGINTELLKYTILSS